MNRLLTAAGVLRSLLIYYGIPGRARRLRRFYTPFIRPGDLCFDVGAHVGNHTRTWLRMGARVVAVEPQPEFARLLRRWYGYHPCVAAIVEAALGAAEGELTIHISTRYPTVSTLSVGWIETVKLQAASFARVRWDIARTVSVTTLDALISKFGEPAYVKIDVEGAEWDVLRGLSRPLRALSFEYVPAAIDVALGCIERLAALGSYQFNWTVGEQMALQSAAWLRGDEMAVRLRTLPLDARSGDIIARYDAAMVPSGRPE